MYMYAYLTEGSAIVAELHPYFQVCTVKIWRHYIYCLALNNVYDVLVLQKQKISDIPLFYFSIDVSSKADHFFLVLHFKEPLRTPAHAY